MMRCPVETDLVAAIQERRWPEASSSDLRRHVLSCNACGEVAKVAGALVEGLLEAEPEVKVPPAASVWWRMQMQLRRDDWITATRYVSRVHTAIVIATIVFFATNALPLIKSGIVFLMATRWAAIASLALPAMVLMFLLYTPAALYVAVSE